MDDYELNGGLDQIRLLCPHWTPGKINKMLCLAVLHQQVDIVEYLLQQGANPDAFDSSNGDNIIIAAVYGCVDIVKLLLDAGAFINICGLVHANSVEVLKYIIDTCRDILPNNIHTFCLKHIIRESHNVQNIDIVDYLVDNGADIHISNNELLSFAATYGQLHIVEKFFNEYTPSSTQIQKAFGCAISISNLTMVKYLHEHGAHVNTPCIICKPSRLKYIIYRKPLEIAVQHKCSEIIQYLVNHGAE